MKKVYIAGPDVFEPDSIAIGERLVKLCEKYGYIGLYPLDNAVDFSQSKHNIAKDIYEANIAMIQKSDIVIANLNSFRGKEPDSGTVWECGYAYALGKKVYGYMDMKSAYIERFLVDEKSLYNGVYVDKNGCLIEDFDHSLNLMISSSVESVIEGDFEDVLKSLQ